MSRTLIIWPALISSLAGITAGAQSSAIDFYACGLAHGREAATEGNKNNSF